MDFFLVVAGVVKNIGAVDSLAQAQAMYPDMEIIERTPANAYHADGSPVNPGDAIP